MLSEPGASLRGQRGSGLWPWNRGPALCDLGTVIRKFCWKGCLWPFLGKVLQSLGGMPVAFA